MGTTFVNGLNSASGESERDSFLELGYVNAFFLEVGVLANKASGVKLGSPGSVGVATANSRALL